ncbi:unnamed protein product, partial [Acidithrix sp. C25]
VPPINGKSSRLQYLVTPTTLAPAARSVSDIDGTKETILMVFEPIQLLT